MKDHLKPLFLWLFGFGYCITLSVIFFFRFLDTNILLYITLPFTLVYFIFIYLYFNPKWCACGDEIMIKGSICENCRFMKRMMKEERSKEDQKEIKMTQDEINEIIKKEQDAGIDILLKNLRLLNSEDINVFKVVNKKNEMISYLIRYSDGEIVLLEI